MASNRRFPGRPRPVLVAALGLPLLLPAALRAQNPVPDPVRPATGSAAGPFLQLTCRHEGEESPLASGDWMPATADLRLRVAGAEASGGRAWRVEIHTFQDGERVPIEVAGLQEWESASRKWIHTDLSPARAAEGIWIWSGTFRPGDEVVLQCRDVDAGRIVDRPTTLRVVPSFGARLAFATPVAVVFPVSGEATLTASAGFAVRYYRISNAPFWRTLDRIGFPAVSFAYATIGGRKSILYAVGFSAINDQLHIAYGGFRNSLTANNFWMVGLSLHTSDLMADLRRALK